MKSHAIRIYGHIYKTQIIRSLTYKFDVYGNIVMQTILMIASAFFWKALFLNCDTVQGINVENMLTYTVVSSMISVMLATKVEYRIMNSVEKGTIAIDMMRPVNIFSVFLAEDLANVTALIFENLIPIFLIGSIFIKLPVPVSVGSFFLFLLSLFMAFWINWFLAAIFGMWAFWVFDLSALLQVKKHLIRLLSGSIIPVWFFPEWLQNILNVFPFVYLYQLPLNIYIGKYTKESLMQGLLIQFIWVLLLGILFFMLQRKVTSKVMIQGG